MTEEAVQAESQPAETTQPNGLRGWILRHDDSWIFTILYVGLAVYLSIAISLFWLVVVVVVHGVFEWVRQHHIDPHRSGVLKRTAWHLKLDFALVLFGLALDVYMGVLLGAAGLGGAARMGAQAGARLAGWTRVIRGVLLSLDDLVHVGRAVMRKGTGGEPTGDAGADPEDLRPWRKWGLGDHLAIGLGAVCVTAILVAPFAVQSHTWSSVGEAVAESMHPWPPGDEA